MPTDLGDVFPPNWAGIPPHMSKRDFAIWRRWHEPNWSDFLAFYFDCAVGKGSDAPEGTNPKLARAWKRLTQKRIDAIGITPDTVWIIEVRDGAGSSAMGAVINYMHLLRDDNPFSLPLRGAIITDRADPDTKRVTEDLGITIIEIGPIE